MTEPAGTVAVKNLDEPDEKMRLEHGDIHGYQPAQAVRCPCGVEIRITDAAALDHLVEAVRQHAAGSHQYEFTREQVLENVVSV